MMLLGRLEKEKEYSKKKALNIKNNFGGFLKIITRQRVPIFYSLREKYNFEGKVLEIGAGSCWLSTLISKIPEVKSIYALDISNDLLKIIGNKVIDCLGGEKNKIKFIKADFNKLPFADNEFNIIIFDASLHHAQNLSCLLKEVGRVLKKNGFLIAIREPIKSYLHFLHVKNFGKSEIKSGATENIYSKQVWKDYFKQAGFDLYFIEDFSNGDKKTLFIKIPPICFLNGVIFSRYHLFAKKSKDKF